MDVWVIVNILENVEGFFLDFTTTWKNSVVLICLLLEC